MHFSGGRFVIMFNGEVYNHMELRAELLPLSGWRGTSDTETLLAGFESLGVTEALEKAVVMFAIALWDKAAVIPIFSNHFKKLTYFKNMFAS